MWCADGIRSGRTETGCPNAPACTWLVDQSQIPEKEAVVAKNQYTYEKRRRELEKKRKNEEKRQRKLDKQEPSPDETVEAPVAQTETEPSPQE